MATTLLFMVKLISWEPRVTLFGKHKSFLATAEESKYKLADTYLPCAKRGQQ